MLFKRTAITLQGERRSVGFPYPDLEVAYTVGQTRVQKGDSLLEVRLTNACESQSQSITPHVYDEQGPLTLPDLSERLLGDEPGV